MKDPNFEPNLFDIARDEAMLDALARRVDVSGTAAHLGSDPLFVDLSAWTSMIDAGVDQALGDEAADRVSAGLVEGTASTGVLAGRGGVHRANQEAPEGRDDPGGESALGRAGRRSVRAGFAVAASGVALSFCGVAAAVNGGHLPPLATFRLPAVEPHGDGTSVLADVPSATATGQPRRVPGVEREWVQPKTSGVLAKRGPASPHGAPVPTGHPQKPSASTPHSSTVPETGRGLLVIRPPSPKHPDSTSHVVHWGERALPESHAPLLPGRSTHPVTPHSTNPHSTNPHSTNPRGKGAHHHSPHGTAPTTPRVPGLPSTGAPSTPSGASSPPPASRKTGRPTSSSTPTPGASPTRGSSVTPGSTQPERSEERPGRGHQTVSAAPGERQQDDGRGAQVKRSVVHEAALQKAERADVRRALTGGPSTPGGVDSASGGATSSASATPKTN